MGGKEESGAQVPPYVVSQAPVLLVTEAKDRGVGTGWEEDHKN